jgi:hypothetical protein
MPTYIELEKQGTFDPSSDPGRVILGVDADGLLSLTDSNGVTIPSGSNPTIYNLGNVSGNTSIDLSNAKLLHKVTLVGDAEFTLEDPYTGFIYRIIINQTLGGELTTWPSNVIWVDNKNLTVLSGLDTVVDNSFTVSGFTSDVPV